MTLRMWPEISCAVADGSSAKTLNIGTSEVTRSFTCHLVVSIYVIAKLPVVVHTLLS